LAAELEAAPRDGERNRFLLRQISFFCIAPAM
jgi:hypothetical protein